MDDSRHDRFRSRQASSQSRHLETYEDRGEVQLAPSCTSRYGLVIVPVLADERLLLLRRCRPGMARWSFEFPQYPDQSSDAPWRQTAEISLLETTGMRAENMRLLGAVCADPARIAIGTVIILARGCCRRFPKPSEACELVAGCVALTCRELDGFVKRGEVVCGTTLSALALYRAGSAS